MLARNTIWNFVGQSAAVIAAIFTVPLLLKGLGTDRFGVLLLVWMLVGYASLFDLGVGRALSRMVADKIGSGTIDEVPVLTWMALLLMFVLGLFATLVIYLSAPWLVKNVLRVPHWLAQETIYTFYLVAVCMPIVITTAGLSGFLEAWQRFDLIAVVNVPMGLFQFVGPLLILPYSKSLVAVMVVILGSGRLVVSLIRLLMCFHVLPALRHGYAWAPHVFGPLLEFGGWLTITNIFSPLMVTLDRFMIGALTSISSVAFYATPNRSKPTPQYPECPIRCFVSGFCTYVCSGPKPCCIAV